MDFYLLDYKTYYYKLIQLVTLMDVDVVGNKIKNEMSGEVSNQFDTYENHSLYVKYEMKRIKKDKEHLLNLLLIKRKN